MYISGQLGMTQSGSLIEGGTLAQAEQALRNIGEILQAAGGSYRDVVKTTVLMKDIREFTEVNKIYAKFFDHHQPARAAFQVAALPKGGDIEIEAVALIGNIQGCLNLEILIFWRDIFQNLVFLEIA